MCLLDLVLRERNLEHLQEEDRSQALKGFQWFLIKQSLGDIVEDIGNQDTSSFDNQTRESFIV